MTAVRIHKVQATQDTQAVEAVEGNCFAVGGVDRLKVNNSDLYRRQGCAACPVKLDPVDSAKEIEAEGLAARKHNVLAIPERSWGFERQILRHGPAGAGCFRRHSSARSGR